MIRVNSWEELSVLEQAELEFKYLQAVLPGNVLDYLDLSDDALENLHTCLGNVIHPCNLDEEKSLTALGRAILSMWRDENSEDIQQAYLHREIDL